MVSDPHSSPDSHPAAELPLFGAVKAGQVARHWPWYRKVESPHVKAPRAEQVKADVGQARQV